MASLVVGIDVGTSAVKAASLVKSGGGYKLKSLALADVRRPEFYPEEDSASAMEAPRRAIERVVKDRIFARKMCACGASGPRVAARLFRFPKLGDKEIASAVRFEAEQVIPFDLGEASLDYVLFDDIMEDGALKTEGLVVATHRDEVDKTYNLLKSTGLDPVIFDIDSLAIANCYVETHTVNKRQVTALLNIGARFSNLTILHGENRVFVRDVASGGDMVSRSISEMYGLDLASAERRKRELMFQGLEGTGDGGLGGAEDEDGAKSKSTDTGRFSTKQDYDVVGQDDMILEDDEADQTATDMPAGGRAPKSPNYMLLQEALSELVHEVEDTFKYYVNKRIVPKVDQLLLTGGSSKLPDVAMYFQEELHVPTQVWNPLEGIDCAAVAKKFPANFLEEIGPYMGVALGLAMRDPA